VNGLDVVRSSEMASCEKWGKFEFLAKIKKIIPSFYECVTFSGKRKKGGNDNKK
jgi:hypothetical protein